MLLTKELHMADVSIPYIMYGDYIVVGVDAQPGREGGTWFGVSSKFAKIGALLNISEAFLDTTKCPRGHLITDYLQTQLDAAAYLQTVARQGHDFNPLNLVLLERRFVCVAVKWSSDLHVHLISSWLQ